MSQKLHRTTCALATACALAAMTAPPSYAAEALSSARASTLTTVLHALDMGEEDTAELLEIEEGVVYETEGIEVVVPEQATEGIQLTTEEMTVKVGLPFADKASAGSAPTGQNTLVYDNHNGSSTVPIVHDDGSIQITTVIENSSAPTRYAYPIALSGKAYLKLESSGAVSVMGSDPSIPSVYIAPPWAKDANGKDVPTHFEITGSTVTQVVDFTKKTAFPVTADPAVYVDYTTASVINVKRYGAIAKWKYLNACTAAAGKTCSISRLYNATSTAQTSLGVSYSVISSSIGVSNGSTIGMTVTCGVSKGPATATLYAQAAKTTYQVRTVRRWGVATAPGGSMKTETKTSGLLTAYKPNGKYTCS